MIGLPSETRVWLASGDDGYGVAASTVLALLVQETLKRESALWATCFVFPRQERRADQGAVARTAKGCACLAKRPGARALRVAAAPRGETVTITAAQLGYLLEGIDWRLPQRFVAAAGSGVMRHGDSGEG